MACTVLYSSFYGSTQQYAEALAARLGTTAKQLEQGVPLSGPTVILAPAHGPMHDGVKYLKGLDAATVQHTPVALVTVGMTLDSEVAKADAAGQLLGPLAAHVERFYLPGRMNYSELSTQHKTVMKGLITALRMKPGKSANERNMIDTYGKDVDRVDVSRLDPIVEWVGAQ
ncbi:flavodoxin domain-containing protein [Corynebacterium sp. Q4381]|uniref:flavodoxin domain-containing protein n=1 Tax=Corynebacterium sp. Marseille-Q4381 TaxID=3121597 RepID=UPI002FE66A97